MNVLLEKKGERLTNASRRAQDRNIELGRGHGEGRRPRHRTISLQNQLVRAQCADMGTCRNTYTNVIEHFLEDRKESTWVSEVK